MSVGAERAKPSRSRRGRRPAPVQRDDYRCTRCGYGIVADSRPERCPMCGGASWEAVRPPWWAAVGP